MGDYKSVKVCVKCYFNKQDFEAIAADAVKAGVRHGGLQTWVQKKNGLADERVANTDKIPKFLKFIWRSWQQTATLRLAKAAELAKKEQELKEERAKLGI